MQRFCKYMGEIESENRVKDLLIVEPGISMENLIENAIACPELFDDYRAGILRKQEAER